MKYYLITGEASGDLHASNLMAELKLIDTQASFRFWGGDRMKDQGGHLVTHINELSFMGFTEVLLNLRKILTNIDRCKKDLLNQKPDVLILVDYPGFNLRIAEFAAVNGIRVVYYISPQVWAWKASRIKKIKKFVGRMITILPFEKEFYSKYGMEVDFVGHPLLDEISKRKKAVPAFKDFCTSNKLDDKPLIAILPGSRRQEISVMLPVMASMSEKFPEYQFVMAGMDAYPDEFYHSLTGKYNVKLIKGKTYELLEQATAALVTSGTATLETALFEVPEVVCYKGGAVSFQIAKWLVKVDFISLVNLIMGTELVPELIQGEFNSKRLETELRKIISNSEHRQKQKDGFAELKGRLGAGGASKKAAQIVYTEATS